MSEDDLFMRVLVGLELLSFLVVLGCCALGVRHTQRRLQILLREFAFEDQPGTIRERLFRKLPPEVRRKRREKLRPIQRELYFWFFFLVLACVMIRVFWETLPI